MPRIRKLPVVGSISTAGFFRPMPAPIKENRVF